MKISPFISFPSKFPKTGIMFLTSSLLISIAISVYSFEISDEEIGVNQFTKEMTEKYLDDCYIMKLRKPGSSSFADTATSVPVIDINLYQPDHLQVLTHFAEAPRYSLMVKHLRQCIVYHISLNGVLNDLDLKGLLNIFTIQAIQIEATFSYIIISEFSTNQVVNSFIMSPKLKNFQHRVLLEKYVTDENNNPGNLEASPQIKSSTSFRLKIYSYFSENGNPGFIEPSNLYSSANELKSLDEIFPNIIRNFNGRTMRITAPPAPPLVLITPSKTQPGKNEIQGQHANILISIAKHFNFTYSLYTSPGGLTGIRLPNGTWNGIMGEILYDRADIGLSVATSYDRYQIVDTTVSVFYAFLVLVSTKPKPIFEWEAIFYPFQLRCWMAFIASTVFTFFVSKWLHNNAIKYEIPAVMKGKSQPEILAKLKAEFMTSYKSFYITFGQLVEQGTPFDFNATPSRMFVIFWMFFAMIITTAYRSKLFTFLTFPRVETPPSTFAELATSTYKWGMKHLGGIAYVFITKSPLSYIRYIGEKMDIYNDKYSCLDRTFKDRFTCIIYKAYIDYMMEVRYWKVRHNFHISDFVTPPVGSAWVLPKYAPWLPAFDKVSYPIYEMGLADKYLDDYQVSIAKVLRVQAAASNSTENVFDLNTNYKGDEDTGPKPLVMANLYAAFFLLMFGLALATIRLSFEIFRHNTLKRKLYEKKRRLRIHLRRKIKLQKQQLPPPKSHVPFQQVVRVILPNSNDIMQLTS